MSLSESKVFPRKKPEVTISDMGENGGVQSSGNLIIMSGGKEI
jgi:hypothetical protein